MHDVIIACLIIYGCIGVSLLVVDACESFDIGSAFAKGIFWPIYLIAKIVKAIIYDIKEGLK